MNRFEVGDKVVTNSGGSRDSIAMITEIIHDNPIHDILYGTDKSWGVFTHEYLLELGNKVTIKTTYIGGKLLGERL